MKNSMEIKQELTLKLLYHCARATRLAKYWTHFRLRDQYIFLWLNFRYNNGVLFCGASRQENSTQKEKIFYHGRKNLLNTTPVTVQP